MNIDDYKELFGGYENSVDEEELNEDYVTSFATKEECLNLSKKHKEEKTKMVKIIFEFENNVTTLELCVDKDWTERRILSHMKKNMWISVEEL